MREHEQAELERIICRRGAGQVLVQRVRILLACADPNSTNVCVARVLKVSRPSVTTWAGHAFRPIDLEGLMDTPRSGVCLFQAGDAAHVEKLNRDAGIPFDRVSEALHLPAG